MRRRPVVAFGVAGAWALFLAAAPPAGAVGFEAQTSKVPGQIMAMTSGDLDGDGLEDVIAAYRRGHGPTAKRYLAVFFRGEAGIGRAPDVAFAAPRGAALFDVGEIDGRPGDELVYLTDTGVWAHGFRGRDAASVKKVLSVLSLVGEPEPGDLPAWDFARELGGGVNGVVVPGRRSLRLFRRTAEGLEPFCRVDVEQRSSYTARGQTAQRRRGGGRGNYAFGVTTTVPNLSFVEATGDQNLDLVTNFDDLVAVHPGTADGCFARKASRRQAFGMRTKEEQRTGGASISAEVADLDGDGIADLALTKVGGGLTDLKTEIRLYRGEKGGGFATPALQRFDSSGFGAFSRYLDVDGDGANEMIQPRAEVSIVSITKVLLSSSVSLDVLVRRRSSTPDRFFDPEPVQTLDTTFGLDFSQPSGLLGAVPVFGHDFDADGRPDVLLSKGSDEMGLHRGRAGKVPFEDDARYGLEGQGSSATFVLEPGAGRRPEVLVWYPSRRGLEDTFLTYRSSVPSPKTPQP